MKNPKREFRISSQRGQALIIAVIFFLIIATTIGMGVINPVLRQVSQADDFARTRASLFASQSVNEDALYRIKYGKKFSSPSQLSFNGYAATATSTTVAGGLLIDSSGGAFNLVRKIETHLTSGSGVSFHYGTQTDKGGIKFSGSSSVSGNVYSNGPVKSDGENQGNLIDGSVVSAGPAGLVSGIHSTASVYGHVIKNSTVDGDAYYNSISGSTVKGTSFPGSADQATSSLPISDALISTWETNAAAGGTLNPSHCPYKTGSNVTLGPVKIVCDLEIDGDNITLAGPVWVVGDISISNSSNIQVSPSLGNQSVQIIADNPAHRSDSSTISVKNGSQFHGSGSAGSFVLMLSQNNSAENNGDTKAIDIANKVSGDLILYAGHGSVELENNVSLKEVTAYGLELTNSANVVYQSGLVNLIFSSGPSGGYVFDKWREVQ